MALALGGATVVPLASRYLPALLADRDWRARHAALICLAQVAEGCVKIMHSNHGGLVDMCLQVRRVAECHAALSWLRGQACHAVRAAPARQARQSREQGVASRRAAHPCMLQRAAYEPFVTSMVEQCRRCSRRSTT